MLATTGRGVTRAVEARAGRGDYRQEPFAQYCGTVTVAVPSQSLSSSSPFFDRAALGRRSQHRRNAKRCVGEDARRRELLRGADPEEEGVARDRHAGVATRRQRQGAEQQAAASITDLDLLADARSDERHPAGDRRRPERLGLHLLPDQVSSRDVERVVRAPRVTASTRSGYGGVPL